MMLHNQAHQQVSDPKCIIRFKNIRQWAAYHICPALCKRRIQPLKVLVDTVELLGKHSSSVQEGPMLAPSSVQAEVFWGVQVLYDTAMASAVFYLVVCQVGGNMKQDQKRLNKLVNKACFLDSTEVICETRMLPELITFTDNTTYHLYETVEAAHYNTLYKINT